MKLGITWCFYLLFILINHNRNSYYASAKSVDIATQQNCHEHVGDFFKSFLNISIVPSEKIGKLSNYQLVIHSYFYLSSLPPPDNRPSVIMTAPWNLRKLFFIILSK
jgi:hypothetical protein